MSNRPSLTQRLLIAGLLAVPMSFAAGTATAQSCKNGSCGGPNNLEKAIAKVEAAESTVSNADLDVAYDRIEQVAEEADDLSAANNSKVRAGLKKLAQTLESRANAEYEDARLRYFEGYYDESLAKFAELAELTGLPSAKKAQRELDKEDDRSAWRAASERATELVDNKSYHEAREALNDMQRLARRSDYTKQTAAAMKGFAEQLMPQVESAEKLIAQGQYDQAYATLLEISRLTHVRESAVAARSVLGKNASLDGMRQARGEYEAGQALAQAKTWYSEIGVPSNQEQELFEQKLQSIANNYKGTAAADQAQQMLVSDDAQAAR
jgi:hypothetical protein